MIRGLRTLALSAVIALVSPSARQADLHAQNWNSPRAMDLVRRGIARRSNQISSQTLAGYRADALGTLSFLGQFGDTAIFPTIAIKHTQVATQVFWQAPASSKQIVVGRRDTTLIPSDLDYYRDRFGIIQSNFPDSIRLGDGKDVAGVLHPLAPSGPTAYDYAVVDSQSIQTATYTIDVYQLAFRPKDPSQPRAMGSAYLDVSNADIVRLDLTFTKSALLDKRNESVSVILQNALVEQVAWLPWRQTVEVVRTDSFLDIGVRGIIRGRWDVCCYDVKFAAQPTFFIGAPLVFMSPSDLAAYKFEGSILDALPPDIATIRSEDVQKLQRQAEDLVSRSFRERAPRAALSVPSISDIVRITRVEGLALGAAGKLRPTTWLGFDGRGRYGFDDEEWKGEAGITLSFNHGRAIRFFGLRDYLSVRDVPEVSGVRNSLAAQEFGSDYTDPIDVRGGGVQLTLGRFARTRWKVEVAHEEHAALSVNAVPENGRYEPTIPADTTSGTRVSLRAEGITLAFAGGTLHTNAEFRVTDFAHDALRVSLDADYSRPLFGGQLVTRTIGAALSGGDLPLQLGVYFGGPITAPGYAFDAFAARRGISQRIEWQTETPFFSLGLGRFGKVPSHATVAPFVHVVWVDGPLLVPGPLAPSEPQPPQPTPPVPFRGDRHGWYPSVGVGFAPLLGMLRIDVARGLRDGRWTFSIDGARIFWPIL